MPRSEAHSGAGQDRSAARLRTASWTITSLAAELGTTTRALRHYESLGLLSPFRMAGKARRYDGDQRDRARMIVWARQFDLPLARISTWMKPGLDPDVLRRQVSNALHARADLAQAEAGRARRAARALDAGDRLSNIFDPKSSGAVGVSTAR